MKFKKTLAALTAALTLSVTFAVPTASNAGLDDANYQSGYASFIADLEAGVHGEKIDDSGFFAHLTKSHGKEGYPYDVYYHEDEYGGFINTVVVNNDFVGFCAEPTDYYKDHNNELRDVLREYEGKSQYALTYLTKTIPKGKI